MSQTIQIECPNCQTINNVKRELPLTESDDEIVFDCGKCSFEVTLSISIMTEATAEPDGEEEEL